MNPTRIEIGRSLLAEAERLTVFTGAGISADSGIPTFRDGGFWDEYPPERFATWSGLQQLAERDPARLAEFVRAVIQPIGAAVPNAAHTAIAGWERRAAVTVITQNVDGLHQAAGNRIVHEVHGSLLQQVDTFGEPTGSLDHATLVEVADRLTNCRPTSVGFWRAVQPFLRREAGRMIRPSIVLFGDEMAEPDWQLAQAAADDCDAMLTVGTSAQVFPAAALPQTVAQRGRPVVHIDPNKPQPIATSSDFYWIKGRAADVVPELLAPS